MTTSDVKNNHRWSGWPGAYCVKCWADDMMEMALADGAIDPQTGEWTEGVNPADYTQGPCPVSDEEYARRMVEWVKWPKITGADLGVIG